MRNRIVEKSDTLIGNNIFRYFLFKIVLPPEQNLSLTRVTRYPPCFLQLVQ